MLGADPAEILMLRIDDYGRQEVDLHRLESLRVAPLEVRSVHPRDLLQHIGQERHPGELVADVDKELLEVLVLPDRLKLGDSETAVMNRRTLVRPFERMAIDRSEPQSCFLFLDHECSHNPDFAIHRFQLRFAHRPASQVPKIRSPASPKPGRMYPFAFSWRSIAAVKIGTFGWALE